MHELELTVNGEPHKLFVEPQVRLAELLRDKLGLTGTKETCDTHSCGACTVLVDGKSMYACSLLALQAQDSDVVTVEGLATDGELDPLQSAFMEHHGMQCGICTPGMIMAAHGLLTENPDPTLEEVRETISGNLCRCGSYARITKAILAAAQELRREVDDV